MKPRSHTLLPLAALAGLALSATSANAAPIGTLTTEAPSSTNTNNHIGTIQATVGDLIETVGSVASEGAVGDGSRHVTASVFNGMISTSVANGGNGGDVNAANAGGYWTTGSHVEFDLDTTTNTLGYDISAINIIQRGDGFRPSINVAVSLRTVGGSFVQIYDTGAVGTASNVNQVAVTDDGAALLGSGIDGVRFDFGNPGLNWTWYRELDVIGTVTGAPTDTTPPTLAGSDIVDDRSGAAVDVNTPVTYTVTFSEAMNAGTVSAGDFSNAGDADVSIGAVAETAPGVFSVAVTPTSGGTLRLQVPVGATMSDLAGNPLDTTTSAILDDTTITVNSDTTPPTLDGSGLVDDQSGGPVDQNTLVTYTVTFSEEVDDNTVSADDFSNAGTATVSFGAIAEISPGVFSVEVTPTSAGTLRLQIAAGADITDLAGLPLNTASAIPDDTEITVEAVAVVATLTSEAAAGSPHAGALITAVSGDLLETVGSVAAESGNGDGNRHVTSSLYDGSITTGLSNSGNGGDPAAANAAGYYGNNHFIEFDLDTTTNTLGYDISLIQIIQRGDGFRGGINVAVSLRPVGGSYTSLIAPPDAGTPGNVNMYAITNGSAPLIASGIDGVRFDFTNTATGSISGWTWYRELDVVGEPTGSGPQITSITSVGVDLWELTLLGNPDTGYEFRSSTVLDFDPGTLVESLVEGGTPVGTVTDGNLLTTDENGDGTVRMTLTGPEHFVRAQIPPPPPPLYSWDFETDGEGFTATGTPNDWAWGTPNSNNDAGLVLTAGNGGSDGCWATGLGDGSGPPTGVINTAADSILRSPDLDFTAVTGAQLSFAAAFDAQTDDTIEILIREVGTGNQLGSTIIPASAPTTSEDWADFGPFDLSAADGKNVYLEFRYVGTDAAFIGWYLDDIEITAP